LIVDAHTYLMPERLFAAVRRYVRANLWHPRYDDASVPDLVQTLLEAGVGRFVCMAHAHRGEMARSLNHWMANVQTTFAPHALGMAAFHPDDGEALPVLVKEAFGSLGLHGARLHPVAGKFALDDPRLDPLYASLTERGLLLSVHAGRRPEPSEYVGARAFARLMRRFPDLSVVVSHAGADEFDAFFDLCATYHGVHVDTAMIFNGYLGGPPPIQRLLEFQDRVVFGSGFPLVPYRLESAITAMRELRLGRALEEKLLLTNAARLLRLDLAELAAEPA
jgi:predicted TIM-barrel fold metal-dependent hydrolase